jgi:hypothetical protein
MHSINLFSDAYTRQVEALTQKSPFRRLIQSTHSKAKLKEQSVVIWPHPPRKSRPVRNVTRWMEQESDWVLVQKKE